MNPISEFQLAETRRFFFGRMATGIGAAALGSLLNPSLFASDATASADTLTTAGEEAILRKLHHAPRASA